MNSVPLFQNSFAACKDFLWNLESGILDAAIRPPCGLCGVALLLAASTRAQAQAADPSADGRSALPLYPLTCNLSHLWNVSLSGVTS